MSCLPRKLFIIKLWARYVKVNHIFFRKMNYMIKVSQRDLRVSKIGKKIRKVPYLKEFNKYLSDFIASKGSHVQVPESTLLLLKSCLTPKVSSILYKLIFPCFMINIIMYEWISFVMIMDFKMESRLHKLLRPPLSFMFLNILKSIS